MNAMYSRNMTTAIPTFSFQLKIAMVKMTNISITDDRNMCGGSKQEALKIRLFITLDHIMRKGRKRGLLDSVPFALLGFNESQELLTEQQENGTGHSS